MLGPEDEAMADSDFDAIEFGKLRRSKTHRWIDLVKSIVVDSAGQGDSGALVCAVENIETVWLSLRGSLSVPIFGDICCRG